MYIKEFIERNNVQLDLTVFDWALCIIRRTYLLLPLNKQPYYALSLPKMISEMVEQSQISFWLNNDKVKQDLLLHSSEIITEDSMAAATLFLDNLLVIERQVIDVRLGLCLPEQFLDRLDFRRRN